MNNQSGTAAVEFALVGPIFLALLFAIFEAGYFFFVTSTVDAAGTRAARLIRTGEAQDGISQDAFFDEICNVVKHIGSCKEQLTVAVKRYDNFTQLAAESGPQTCRDVDENGVNFTPYETGQARDIVRVRICYLHKTISPGIGLHLAKDENGNHKIITNMIFRNEPFD